MAAAWEALAGAPPVVGCKRKFDAAMEHASEWGSAATHRLMGVAFFASALMGVIPLQQLLKRLQKPHPDCQAVPLGAASSPSAQRSKRRAADASVVGPATQPHCSAGGGDTVALQAPQPLEDDHDQQQQQRLSQQEEACQQHYACQQTQAGENAGAHAQAYLDPMDVEREPEDAAASPPPAEAAPLHAAACALEQQPGSVSAGPLSPTALEGQDPYNGASQDQQEAAESPGCSQHAPEPQQAATQMPPATLSGTRKLSRMQLRQQLLQKRAAQAAALAAVAAAPALAAPSFSSPQHSCRTATAVAAEDFPEGSAEAWPAAEGGASSREVQRARKCTRGNRLLGLVKQHNTLAQQQQVRQQAESQGQHPLEAQQQPGRQAQCPAYLEKLAIDCDSFSGPEGPGSGEPAAAARSCVPGPHQGQAPQQQQQERPQLTPAVQAVPGMAAFGGEGLAEQHVSLPGGGEGGPLSSTDSEAGPPSPAGLSACGSGSSQRRLTQSPFRWGRDAAALPGMRGAGGGRGSGATLEEQEGARQPEVWGRQPEQEQQPQGLEQHQQVRQQEEPAGGQQAQQAEQQQGATPPTPPTFEAPTLPVAPQAAPHRTQAASPDPARGIPPAAEVLKEGLALVASRRAAEQQALLLGLQQQQEPPCQQQCQWQDERREPQQAQHGTPQKAVGCSRASLTAAFASGPPPGGGGDDTPGPSPLTGGARRTAAAALQRVSQLVSDLAVGDDEEAAPSPHPCSGRSHSSSSSSHGHVSKRRRCLLSVISQQGQAAATPSKGAAAEEQGLAVEEQQHGEQPQQELPSAGLPSRALLVPTAAGAGEQQEQAPSLSPSPANLIALAPAALASSSPAPMPAAATSPLDAFPGFWVAQPPAAPCGSGADAAIDTAVTPAPGQGGSHREGQSQPDLQATPDLGCLGPKQAQQEPGGGEASLAAAAAEPGPAAAGLAEREGGEEAVRQEQAEGPDRRERKVRFSLPSPAEGEEAAGWGENLMHDSGAYSHRLPRLGSGTSRPGTPSRPHQPGRVMRVPAPPAFSRFGSTAFRKYSGPAGRRAALLSSIMTADAGGSVCFALPPAPPPPPSPMGDAFHGSGSSDPDLACPAPAAPAADPNSGSATDTAAAAAKATASLCAAAIPEGGGAEGDVAGWAASLLGSAGDSLGGASRAEAGAVEIPRRLRHPQPAARCRRPSMEPLPSPKDSALQDLREAFLNARLAGCWQRGEAWARLDLAGVELEAGEGPGLRQRLDKLWAVLCEAQGRAAAQAVEARLEGEWQHLQRVRQRYAARAAGTAAAAAAQSPSAAEASPGSHAAAATPRPAGRGAAPRGILKQPSPLSAAKPEQPHNRHSCSPGASPPYHLLVRQQQLQSSPSSATPPPHHHHNQQQPPGSGVSPPHHPHQQQQQQAEQGQQEQYQERLPRTGVAAPGAEAGEASPMNICGPPAIPSQPGASAPSSACFTSAPEGSKRYSQEYAQVACQGMASPGQQPEAALVEECSAAKACTAALLAGQQHDGDEEQEQAAELATGPQPGAATELHESAAGMEGEDGPEPSLQLTPDPTGHGPCSAAAAAAPVDAGGLEAEGPLELTPDAAVELTPGPAPSRGLKMLQSAGALAAARAGTAGATPTRQGPSPTARVALTFTGQHHSSTLGTPSGVTTCTDSVATGTAWAAGGGAARRAKATRGARLLQAGLQAGGGQRVGVSHALANTSRSSGDSGGRLAAVASEMDQAGEPGAACDCQEVA